MTEYFTDLNKGCQKSIIQHRLSTSIFSVKQKDRQVAQRKRQTKAPSVLESEEGFQVSINVLKYIHLIFQENEWLVSS